MRWIEHGLVFGWLCVTIAGCGSGASGESPGPAGWAVGWAEGGEGVILRSDDFGHTWSVAERYPTPLSSIDFVDRETGWAVGEGGILRTDDGGRTWRSLDSSFLGPPPRPLQTVTCESKDTCVIQGSFSTGGRYASTAFYADVTRDGGSTWSEVSGPLAGGYCWTSTGASIAVQSEAVYLNSGGANEWEFVSTIPRGAAGTISCGDSGVAWIAGGEGIRTASPMYPYILIPFVARSLDDGRTWQESESVAASSDYWADFQDIASLGTDAAWVAGTRFLPTTMPWIIRTTDGGDTWEVSTLPEVPPSYLVSVTFADAQMGAAAGYEVDASRGLDDPMGAVAFVTTDGGATWSLADVPPDVVAIVDVELLPRVSRRSSSR